MFPTFWNQHVAVEKKQLWNCTYCPVQLKSYPPAAGYMMWWAPAWVFRHESSTYMGRKKCCNDDDESDQSYRGTARYVYGSMWQQQLSNCTPDLRPPPPRLLPTAGNGTAQQSITTSMTMSRQYSGRMAGIGSRDTSRDFRESVFRTRVLYPGGRKKCCNDGESDVLVWQQLSDCTAHLTRNPLPPPAYGAQQQVSVQQSVATSMTVGQGWQKPKKISFRLGRDFWVLGFGFLGFLGFW